jgi:ribonucleotide reductase alpha subunit
MQMTDECLIWSGNEEVWPFREKAKPAPRGHKVAKEGEGGGALMVDRLVNKMRELGVRIETDTAVHELYREDGRIVGVRAKSVDGEKTVRALDVKVDEHVAVIVAAQRNVDSAVSKTCNVPTDFPYNDFKEIYWKVFNGGGKGCTTYRPNGNYADVITAVDVPEEKVLACSITGDCSD